MEEVAIVYMVAGLSSRFGGKIKALAKVTDDETLIEYSLNQALPAGFTKIIFIVGRHTEQPFKEKFGNNYKGIPIVYCLQEYDENKRDKPWGTADALCCAKDEANCSFVVCNGDDLYGGETFEIIVEHLKNNSTCATAGYRLGNVLSEKGGVNRGIFKINGNIVESITETFNITKENLYSMGLNENNLSSQQIWGLSSNVLNELKERLIYFKKNHEGDRKAECLLPSELTELIKQKKIIIKIYPTKGKWFGITNPGDELIIKEQLKN
ncbi:Nucleotidyl transferase [uncultured archaeon]|nr:Nucleotidyl transferase [uncultured archaeon]